MILASRQVIFHLLSVSHLSLVNFQFPCKTLCISFVWSDRVLCLSHWIINFDQLLLFIKRIKRIKRASTKGKLQVRWFHFQGWLPTKRSQGGGQDRRREALLMTQNRLQQDVFFFLGASTRRAHTYGEGPSNAGARDGSRSPISPFVKTLCSLAKTENLRSEQKSAHDQRFKHIHFSGGWPSTEGGENQHQQSLCWARALLGESTTH